MSERREMAPEPTADSTESSIDQFWSALSMGCLFVAAAVLSPAVHALSGEWPAGYGGWAAAAYGVVGVTLLGYSYALDS